MQPHFFCLLSVSIKMANPHLQYALTRLQGVSTNRVMVEPLNGGGSASPNSLIRFSVPSNTLWDTRGTILSMDAKCTGATLGGRLPPKIDSLINRVSISAGGVQLASGCNLYNVFRHAKDSLTKDHTDSVSGHPEMVREVSYVDASTILTKGPETYTAGQRNFSVCHWEGFLGSVEPSIIDTSLLPSDIIVEIEFAPTSVLSCVNGVLLPGKQSAAGTVSDITFTDDNSTGGASYSIENLRMSFQIYGMAGSLYNEMIQSRMESVGFIELVKKDIYSFEATNTGSTRVQVSSQSVDRVWAVHRATGFDTQKAPLQVTGGPRSVNDGLTGGAGGSADQSAAFTAQEALVKPLAVSSFDSHGRFGQAEKYLPSFFNFKENLTNAATPASYQFEIQNVSMPQSAVSAPEMYAISKEAILGYDYAMDKSLKQYRDNYFVQCLRLNLKDSESIREISGIDSRGQSLEIRYKTTGISNTSNLVLFVECSSTIRVGGQRQISVLS